VVIIKENCTFCSATFQQFYEQRLPMHWGTLSECFYAWKRLLLSAHLSHHNSVCPSVHPSLCLSVCHTGGSVKTVRYLED